MNQAFFINWSGREDLNLRPLAPQASALIQAALRPDVTYDFKILFVRFLETIPPNTRFYFVPAGKSAHSISRLLGRRSLAQAAATPRRKYL